MLAGGDAARRLTNSRSPTAAAANDVWCVDFKGWFRTGDGERCDPFTLSDAFSRYLLRCDVAAHPDHDHVRPILRRRSASSGCRGGSF